MAVNSSQTTEATAIEQPPAEARPGPKRTLRSQQRRSEICLAAGQLFYERGYVMVTLKDVTDEVGITAPAIYRHFANKRDLLRAVIDAGLDAVESELQMNADDGSLNSALASLAAVGVARPYFWFLMVRESRHLEPEERAPLRKRLAQLDQWLSARIAAARPELAPEVVTLITRAAMAVFSAPSAYSLRAPAKELEETLAEAAERVVFSNLEAQDQFSLPDLGGPDDEVMSRREAVLLEASRLFSRSGYESVSLAEIGEAVGMSGPSLYHYFDSKSDILASIFRRALEWLAWGQVQSAAPATGVAGELHRHLESYASLSLNHRELFRLFVHERFELRKIEGGSIIRAYRDYMESWVVLLRRMRPELSQSKARSLVAAAQSVVNELSITPALEHSERTATILAALAADVLRSPE